MISGLVDLARVQPWVESWSLSSRAKTCLRISLAADWYAIQKACNDTIYIVFVLYVMREFNYQIYNSMAHICTLFGQTL